MNPAGPSASTKGGEQKPAATVNERTYQEVEYLKKNLGPILVAALAEICIRRPADPIEYLGHWLLRWRYNEELKRRDVQNALDVVRQRQWAQVQEETAAAKVEKFASGFIPGQEHGPPGYGGPLSGEELGETKEVVETDFHPVPPPAEHQGEEEEIPGEHGGASARHLEDERKASLGSHVSHVEPEHHGVEHHPSIPESDRKHSLEHGEERRESKPHSEVSHTEKKHSAGGVEAERHASLEAGGHVAPDAKKLSISEHQEPPHQEEGAAEPAE